MRQSAPNMPTTNPTISNGIGSLCCFIASTMENINVLIFIRAVAGPSGPWEQASEINTSPIVFAILPIVPYTKYLIFISGKRNKNTDKISPHDANAINDNFAASNPFLLTRYLL